VLRASALGAVTPWSVPCQRNDGRRLRPVLPAKRAKDLHDRRLLVHGSGDDNVQPHHTWHVLDELVKVGMPFDLMVHPMRGHGIEDRPARIHPFKKMVECWRPYL